MKKEVWTQEVKENRKVDGGGSLQGCSVCVLGPGDSKEPAADHCTREKGL